MYETLLEACAELGSVGVRAVGALCATVAGVFVEMNGVATLDGDPGIVGIWMTLLGCLFLVVGIVLARDALRRFRRPTA